MENKREHTRHPLSVSVRISHPEIGEKVVMTKNISDNVLYLLVKPTKMPPCGDIIEVQIQGMLDDPPVIKMKVVRVEEEGLGLQFIGD